MSYALFIDDERFPVEDGRDWEIARTLEEGAEVLARRGSPSFISVDADIGDGIPTGYDFAKALVDADIDGTPVQGISFSFTEGFEFYVHSQNPVGAKNIQTYLENYLRISGKTKGGTR